MTALVLVAGASLFTASAVRSAVQFAEVAVVGSIKILLDVHEVNYITIFEIMVRFYNSVSFSFSAFSATVRASIMS